MYVSNSQADYYQAIYQTKTNSSPIPSPSTQKNGTQAASSAAAPAFSAPPKTTGDLNAALLALQETGPSPEAAGTTYQMGTNHGDIPINLDEYFANAVTPRANASIDDVPLLIPSAENIKALSDHASTRFQQLLRDYNIPEAPSEITYDNEGRMQLPDDYAYGDELKQALEENPGLARELSTLNALTSHYVELQKRVPLHNELQEAKSQAEIDAILQKYSHLLQDNGSYSNIALTFGENGNIRMQADGSTVSLA